jgi:hypothetical protein
VSTSSRGALLVCLGAALGCAKPEPGKPSGPRLAVHWTGADTAAFSAAATAEHCDTAHMFEIRAISGDTGVGLALYDSGATRAGTYPIRPPEKADSTAPAAAVALRWFSKTTVQGFQGDSGEVRLREARPGVFSGTFRGVAHAISGAGRLEMTGSFDGLRLGRPSRSCGPGGDSTAASRDSTTSAPDSGAIVD